MTIAELLLPEFDTETVVTRNVLARVPDEHIRWKPHEKSFPMGHLAQLVARLPGWVGMVTERTEMDLAPKGGPTVAGYSFEPTAKLLEEFEKNTAAGRASLAKTTDEDFQVTWSLKKAGQTLQSGTRYEMLRLSVLNHLVHHRAQLGLYLRMLNEKVPEMYGPTADTKG
jgi:uncharacterized damage-inducible protein DinB